VATDSCQMKYCSYVSGEVKRVKMRVSDPVMSACLHVSKRFSKLISVVQ
jgi:hypothetical protein